MNFASNWFKLKMDKKAAAENQRRLLFISFNQNQSCFLMAGEGAYKIYACDSLQEKGSHNFKQGNIGQMESLYNFVALVGGGVHPLDSPNKVVIWDSIDKKAALSLQFDSAVKAVRLCRKCIVVVLQDNVKILSFEQTPKPLAEYKTLLNPEGLCALAAHNNKRMLAIPSLQIGQVQIIDLEKPLQEPYQIQAHEAALSCLAMNITGTRLATASERGTLIRIFDTQTGQMLAELRRGHTQANIYCINFNQQSTMLVACSNHGTVHVFKFTEIVTQCAYSYYMPQYFQSQSSFVKLSIPQVGPRSVCAFGPDSRTVIVVTENGHFYKYGFTADGTSRLQQHRQIDHLTEYDFV